LFAEITPTELNRRRQNGELWQLVDVREPWEVETASVEGANCIPMAEIPRRFTELDRATPVAVLCHSGGRSARVAAFLCENGFASVANVTGGIDAWSLQVDAGIPRY
jgi:rhodanese-related sulfurtransferase